MPHNGADESRRLRTGEVATRLRVHPRTIERWRRRHIGPPYLKINGRVLYPLEDLKRYEQSHRRPGDAP